MKRRDFMHHSFFASGAIAFAPSAQAAENCEKEDLCYRDGSANMLAHDFESNLFQKTNLFSHGEVLDATSQVIYDRKHLLLSPFNHPKRNSDLLLYCEFDHAKKLLSH